jgi:hypothetical protein
MPSHRRKREIPFDIPLLSLKLIHFRIDDDLKDIPIDWLPKYLAGNLLYSPVSTEIFESANCPLPQRLFSLEPFHSCLDGGATHA